jgi:hypothetical protein
MDTASKGAQTTMQHPPQTPMDARLDLRLGYEHRGDTYSKAQRWADARYYYREALKLAPKDKGLQKKLQKVEEHLGVEHEPVKAKITHQPGQFDRPAPPLLSVPATAAGTSAAASDGHAPK